MKLFIDAHALIWAAESPSRLSTSAAKEIRNVGNDRLVSAATIWEVAIKWGLGKLRLSQPYKQWMSKAIADLNASIVPLTIDYADRQAGLPRHHRDPFDRLLVAQALTESAPIVSNDTVFEQYGITRIW